MESKLSSSLVAEFVGTGPALCNRDFADLWLYFAGPAIGGILAALLYKTVLKPAEE